MDKEMKKLLLVAVSVGVFLMVTITVAIIFLTPKTQVQQIAFSDSSFNTPAPNALQPTSTPSPAASPLQEPVDMSAERDTNARTNGPPSIAIISENNNRNNQTPMQGTGTGTGTAQNRDIQAGSQPPQPSAGTQQAETRTTPAPTAAPSRTTASTPAATARPSATPVPTTRPSATTSTPRPTATPASTSARTITDYWVQTGAFAARIRAEDAKEFLASKGIVSIIENREINGRVWYRVRLGPYVSENEAKHWLEVVKVIDGFGESQIRQTVRMQ
jgi:DedD protein